MTMSFGDIWGTISDTIGIGTFIVSIIIWYLVKREKDIVLQLALQNTPSGKGFKTLSEENREIKSKNPVALCVCLIETVESIKPPVEDFLKSNAMEMPFREINFNGISNLDDMTKLNEALIKTKREITAEGKSEVHLFIAGPVFAGVLLGAVFDNWIPVKVYHKGKVSYEYQYLLQ